MKISSASSRGLLLRLMVVHVLGTLFAYIVYIKLSSLGDGYHPAYFGGFWAASGYTSTVVVWGIYFILGAVLPGFIAPMALGLVVAILTWHAFRDVYMYIGR